MFCPRNLFPSERYETCDDTAPIAKNRRSGIKATSVETILARPDQTRTLAGLLSDRCLHPLGSCLKECRSLQP